MLSRGTMEREDEVPPKFRQTLAVRPEEDEGGGGLIAEAAAAVDAVSEAAASEIMNESVVSSVVDK